MVSYEFHVICDGGGGVKTWLRGFPGDGLVAVEPQPRACGMSPKARVPIVTLTVTLLSFSPFTLLKWSSRGEKMPLTAVRIVHCIVCHVDGASIELALGWDIRNARCDFLPRRLGITVVREESSRLPYRWEVVYILGNGRVRIYCALDVRVFVKILAKSDKQTAIMRTSDLCLRLLRAVVLGEDRRCDGGDSGEELKRS